MRRFRKKYGNKFTVVDGIKFHSKKEANRWCQLRKLEQDGEIATLKRQVRIPLSGANGPILTDSGKSQRVYVADFTYVENGMTIIEDAKGYETPEFKLKRAILAAQGVEILTS